MTHAHPAPVGPLAIVCEPQAARRAHARGEQAWWLYHAEVLEHLRMPHDVRVPRDLLDLDERTRVVVLPRPEQLSPEAVAALLGWTQRGGAVLCWGGPGTFGLRLGVSVERWVDEAYLVPAEQDDGPAGDGTAGIHGFGGSALRAPATARVLASWTSATGVGSEGITAVAAVRIDVGLGSVVVDGADPWQSIVRIQQGWPVQAAGPAPADGTAPTGDGILRCCDGIALSYQDDRALPPGAAKPPLPYRIERPPPHVPPIFNVAHADRWRELVLNSILAAAARADALLPWLHYWPAGVDAVAHMSHDSDRNIDEQGRLALSAFAAADVRVTWCHCFPGGYAPDTVSAIAAAGHEQALHYNAIGDVPGADWSPEAAAQQVSWAAEITGTSPVSNKNHYTCWQGWTDIYDWWERLGIEIDQSRGPSRQGNVGFPFGTAHVGFPMADHRQANRRYDVLSLPLHTQDLHYFVNDSVRAPILAEALARHGVAHFLFHGSNMADYPGVADAVRETADAARTLGMPWWTSREINEWERTRRAVQLSLWRSEVGWRVRASAASPVPGAAVLVPLESPLCAVEVHVRDGSTEPVRTKRVTRHGRTYLEVSVDLPRGDVEWEIIPCRKGESL